MINLIPNEARQRVQVEYWTRVATVWAWLGAVAAVVIICGLVPVYVLIHLQLNAYTKASASIQSHPQSFTVLSHEITRANALAAALAQTDALPTLSSYIDRINTLAPSGIVINTIALARSTSTIDVITVTGQAATRQNLAAFKDALSADPAFQSADLPLSNLAKDTKVPFSITVTPAPPTKS